MKTTIALSLAVTSFVHAEAKTAAAKDQKQPNIIFLMTDDQAFNTIAAHGNTIYKTPNMDQLAYDGVSFMSHYATTSISMASRAITLTGMYEYKTGVNFMHGGLESEKFEKSYPVILRNSGYYTGFAGKFGFCVSDKIINGAVDGDESVYSALPIDKFDEWGGGTGQTEYETIDNKYIAKYADEYPHSTRAYGAFACDFIDNAIEEDKPFCLSISFKAPHAPQTADPMFDHVYESTVFKLPESVDYSDLLPKQARLGRQYLYFFDKFHGADHYQEIQQKYHQQIHGVDYAIGMIREKLKERGIDENTIIIFTSDNGFSLGSHRLGGKVLPYETMSRIPLIIVDPRDKSVSGSTTTSISGNIDIAPTILDYAGIDAPDNMDGISLCKVVNNPKKEARKNISLMNVWGTPQTFEMAIVEDGMKYIYWPYNEGMESCEELYDVSGNDVHELCNLASDPKYASTMKRMRKLYDERLAAWETECTRLNGYLPCVKVLERNVPWEVRKEYIAQPFWNAYVSIVKRVIKHEDEYDYDNIIKKRL